MRILLDECVPARLKEMFSGHAAQTVPQVGWRSSKDQPLLEGVQDRYDVFVTVDRNLEKEYDLATYRMGFVVIRLPNNRLESFERVRTEILKAIENVKRGQVVR